MVVGLLVSFCIGWLMGGVGNWLADQLPHLPQRPLRFARDHYVRSLAPFGRATHPWRCGLLNVGMAAAFALGWWRVGDDWGQLLVAWFYTVWLLVVLVIDFEHRRVLNLMLPAAVAVALLAPVLTLLGVAHLPTFGSALLGGLAGFLVFLLIFVIGRGRMMGAGDVKLAGVIGLMVGYPLVWGALTAGIVLGGLVAIFIIVSRRASAKSYMAYGPYLALGALLVLWLNWP
jgi:prepilin signal peptidase PulO-like enzyme (type II secretory pathway)